MRVISLSLSLVQAHFTDFFFGEGREEDNPGQKSRKKKEKIQVSSSTQTATFFST